MSTQKMNQKVKKLWLKALRSGEYEQAVGTLRYNSPYDGTSFCCLGVLCNLHAKEFPEIASKETDSYSYLGESEVLPVEVMEWAGLNSPYGNTIKMVYKSKISGSITKSAAIAKLNDDGFTFIQLANAIEKQL